jgi:hypothetical protein
MPSTFSFTDTLVGSSRLVFSHRRCPPVTIPEDIGIGLCRWSWRVDRFLIVTWGMTTGKSYDTSHGFSLPLVYLEIEALVYLEIEAL